MTEEFRVFGNNYRAYKKLFKDYFTWAPKRPKKPTYDMDEVMQELMVDRRKKTFQNLCLDNYYWFKRNFDFIWTPCILKGYLIRAWQIVSRKGHWSDRDIWSLDYTIAKFALPRLIRLKEVMHGVPNSMFEPLPKGKYNHNKKQMKAAEKKWNGVLDEIIFAMDYVANCREHDYYPKKLWPEKTKSEDYKELRAVEERVQKGLELFGKYFRNLWD